MPAMPASYTPEVFEAIPMQTILDAHRFRMIDPAAS
jgi:hypothetical protein